MESKDKIIDEFSIRIEKAILEFSSKILLTGSADSVRLIVLAHVLITKALAVLLGVIWTNLKTKGDRAEAIVLLQTAIKHQIDGAHEVLEQTQSGQKESNNWFKDVEEYLKGK